LDGLILTSVLGNYDAPRKVKVKREPGIRYWMFADKDCGGGWQATRIECKRGALFHARQVKVCAPMLYPTFDWFLWLDGTMQLKVEVLPWVSKLLESGVNFAAFKHREWPCAYREINACKERGKDSEKNLDAARLLLRSSNFPVGYGQVETGFLWRRSCPEVREHARIWWDAMKKTTMRDQATFMWALKECGQEVELLPGVNTKNKLVRYKPGHRK
jgi:hypothetical protein